MRDGEGATGYQFKHCLPLILTIIIIEERGSAKPLLEFLYTLIVTTEPL